MPVDRTDTGMAPKAGIAEEVRNEEDGDEFQGKMGGFKPSQPNISCSTGLWPHFPKLFNEQLQRVDN